MPSLLLWVGEGREETEVWRKGEWWPRVSVCQPSALLCSAPLPIQEVGKGGGTVETAVYSVDTGGCPFARLLLEATASISGSGCATELEGGMGQSHLTPSRSRVTVAMIIYF